MAEVDQPFPDKVSRNLLSTETQSEYICNLGGKDRDCNAACETYNNGIGDKLNDCSQLEHS